METKSRPRITVLYHYFYPDDVVSARHFTQLCEAGTPLSVYLSTSSRSKMPSVIRSPLFVTGMNYLACPSEKLSKSLALTDWSRRVLSGPSMNVSDIWCDKSENVGLRYHAPCSSRQPRNSAATTGTLKGAASGLHNNLIGEPAVSIPSCRLGGAILALSLTWTRQHQSSQGDAGGTIVCRDAFPGAA